MPTLVIPLKNKEDMDRVFHIEDELHKLGIDFDTGYDGKNRYWELDYSLEGAVILTKEGKG